MTKTITGSGGTPYETRVEELLIRENDSVDDV